MIAIPSQCFECRARKTPCPDCAAIARLLGIVPKPIPVAKQWSVYCLWLAGVRQYVGCTSDPAARQAAHRKNGVQFDRFEVLGVRAAKRLALSYERRNIRRFLPPLNVMCAEKRHL